ncbi:MAG: hypothetical protein LBV26_05925 [Bacteroidales bacterium]|jgi:hypothetical protein|nr:hypothetical protein [Bacteroidales bacterium]
MITNTNSRSYNCKDEELPFIASFVLANLKRDRQAFKNFSPRYSDEYVAAFEQEIKGISELVNPRTNTNDIKRITGWLYGNLDSAFDIARYVEGYISMSHGEIPVSARDFGIANLRKCIKARDAEGAISSLRFINANIVKYKTELQAQGLKDETIKTLAFLTDEIAVCNNEQYKNALSRKDIVYSNKDKMNTVNAKIKEICKTGKLIFRRYNPEKLKGYTFTSLLKDVRVVYKNTKQNEITENNTENTENNAPQQ